MTATDPVTTESPVPSRGIPVVSDLLRVIKAMFSPGDAYAEAKPFVPFWGPWLAVTLVFMVAAWLMSPYQMRVQELAMIEQGREVPASMKKLGPIMGLLFTPIVSLLLASIAALVLWVTTSLMGGEARFKQMLSVNIHTWGPFLIQQFVMFTILRMRGLDTIRTPRDLQVGVGLDLLLPSTTEGFMRGLAMGINPFSIWGMVITAVGLQVMIGLEKGRAWTVAIVALAVSLVVGATITGMFTR